MILETRIVQPRDLLNPRRLDLVVKWRLFRHWMGDDYPEAEREYIWHIDQRVGARKPLVCYLSAARKLWTSMQETGFDPSHPIPINRSGMLLEGAHRTACSLALGKQAHTVVMDTDHQWPDWGEEWFRSHGMTIELPGILSDYERLKGQ